MNEEHHQPDNTPQLPYTINKEQVDKEVTTDMNRQAAEEDQFLEIKKAHEWLEKAMLLPKPVKLFDRFWNERELCILFADTNIGKSILAVQIANSISRGEPIPGFELETEAQPVLYFDFELNCKQFELRYSNDYTDHYVFHPNLHRAEIKRGGVMPNGCDNLEDCIVQAIENAIHNHSCKVLIIDNLTYLKDDNERARDAKPLMHELERMKEVYGISILILAHTPKRDLSRPIILNDLQGSKMLMNFIDSCFCIGNSTQDKNLRYLKQIKVRDDEFTYTADNVALCRLEKPHNFLGFTLIGTSSEREHLREKDTDKSILIQRAKELKEEGMKQREIADELGIGLASVNRYLKAS